MFGASLVFAAPPSVGQACVDAVKADPEEARSICVQAHAKDPSPRVTPAYALTLALSEEDSCGQVYELTREAEAEDGDDPELLALIVQACTVGEQRIYAKEVGERLAESAGDDWWSVMVLYGAALDRGDYSEARELLDRLGELDTPAEERGAAEERYAVTVPPLNHGLMIAQEPQKPATEAEIAARLDAELSAGDPVIGGLPLSSRVAKNEALKLPGPEAKASGRTLAELLQDHALLYAVFTNAYRIHLERTLNRFVSLVPELEEEIEARGAVQIDRVGL